MTDKKTPDEKSISGGMTEREAMQRVIDLQAKLRESGEPVQPLSAGVAPSQKSETWWADLLKERWPALTEAEAEEFLKNTGLG